MKYAIVALDVAGFRRLCSELSIRPIDAKYINTDHLDHLRGFYAEQVYPEWMRDDLVKEGFIHYMPKREEDGTNSD